jgi:adenosylhomocysteinase
VLVTVTGAPGIIGAAELPLLKDGVIILNGGHFPHEVDVAALAAGAEGGVRYEADGIETFLRDGRAIHLLGGGHMANLAGPRPLGNSVESMDLGFTLQARCLELVAKGGASAEQCVVPVPKEIDAAVAEAYLALNR